MEIKDRKKTSKNKNHIKKFKTGSINTVKRSTKDQLNKFNKIKPLPMSNENQKIGGSLIGEL
jgi:hypothetical protein